jgi:hypothetical protein
VNGPFETEHEARQSPAVQAAYGAWSPRLGSLTGANHAMLFTACTTTGVELGAYDRRILRWLAGFEPQTCAVIAGIISRAASAAPPLSEQEPPFDVAAGADLLAIPANRIGAPESLAGLGERAILRHALADAIAFRSPEGICPDCDAHPASLCEDHAEDLDKTDAYLALARDLGIEVDR